MSKGMLGIVLFIRRPPEGVQNVVNEATDFMYRE